MLIKDSTFVSKLVEFGVFVARGDDVQLVESLVEGQDRTELELFPAHGV